VAALGVYYVTGVKIWGVIAQFGAWVNLFNLIPVWQLDGSRGLRSLTRTQRGLVLLAAATLWLLVRNPMLIAVALCCVYRMFTRDWQTEPDNRGLAQFLGLLAALSAVLMLSPGAPRSPRSADSLCFWLRLSPSPPHHVVWRSFARAAPPSTA